MSRRKEPFPSSIEGCEDLLQDITSYDRERFRECEIPPRHLPIEFLPKGALLGEYGSFALRPKDLLIVHSLSDPDDLKDPSRLLYNVTCVKGRRRYGAMVPLSEWYSAPRGEGYSTKRIAAMALFYTYRSELNDQENVRQLWETRERAVHQYEQERTLEQEQRDLNATRLERWKLAVRLYNKAEGTELPEHIIPTAHTSFPDYIPLQEHVTSREEPTNEELGLSSPQTTYEQPPWHA
jgi:hypothetical protein